MTDPTREQIDESPGQYEPSEDPARQAAYRAVFEVIARIPPRSAGEYDQVCENGRVWRGVQAALDAFEVALRPSIMPKVMYDNLKQLRDEARAEAADLALKLKLAQEHIADLEFVVGEGDLDIEYRHRLLDQQKQRVKVLWERIAKVRELADNAPENCACHGDTCWPTGEDPCCIGGKRPLAAKILAVLDGEGGQAS